ncbi:MAG: TadE/TadG family type IV pilus assembly protein [Hyphomicrobiales bacterium]
MTAVEFALLFPIMLTLYWGAVDISQLLTADRKVTSVASTTADLVAQAETLDAAALTDIYNAASEILAPLPDADLSIVVTSITIDEDGDPEVDWSNAHNGSARTTISGITIPAGMIVGGGSIVLAEVSYLYDSVITKFVSQNFRLADAFFLRPRKVERVVFE